MSWLQRLRRAMRPDEDERAVLDELTAHIEFETQELVRTGIPVTEVRRRALLAFGGVDRVRAEANVVRRGAWLSLLPTELLWAWRAVRGRGAGSAFHVALVSIAVAAASIVFSAVDSFVLNPVPYPNADRLVVFQRSFGPGSPLDESVNVDEITQWQRQTDLFDGLAAYSSSVLATQIAFDEGAETIVEAIDTAAVAPGLFEMLGVKPAYGRPFVADDLLPGKAPVATISTELARRLFGTASKAVNQTIATDGAPVQVVGVMPRAFRFPRANAQVWRPLAVLPPISARQMRAYSVVALRAPAWSFDALRSQVETRRPSLVAELSEPTRAATPTIVSLSAARRDPRAALLFLLLGAAAALLALACVNVAGLEIAASVDRARTFAVQAALGATRSTLVRTILWEAFLLSLLASIASLLLATWGSSLLTGALPPATRNAIANPIDIDARVVSIGVVAIGLTWLASALPLVWRASRRSLFGALRAGTTATMSKPQLWTRHALLTVQVALSVVLLIGAVLFVRSYSAHIRQDRGFDSANLMTLQILPPTRMNATEKGTMEDAVRAGLTALPVVRGVSVTESLLPSTTANSSSSIRIGADSEPDGRVQFRSYLIDSAYPEVVGLRLRAGRWVSPIDPPGAVVIDEALGRRFWPAGDMLGAEFITQAGPASGDMRPDGIHFRVVGVAGRVHGDNMSDPDSEQGVYVLYSQLPRYLKNGARYAQLRFVIRLDQPGDLGQVATVARQLAPGTVVRAELLDDRYARLYGDTRVAAGVTSGFGTVGLLVAVLGIYALMMMLVAGRKREIGIRLALGASGTDVRYELLKAPMYCLLLGIVVGVALAAGAARFVEQQLFGVHATDIATYAGVATILALTGLTATWRPLRIAAQVDPVETLRAE